MQENGASNSWISHFTQKLLGFRKPIVRASEPEEEEEIVDPQDTLKEKCTGEKHCAALQAKLEECNARVSSRSKTAETCEEELFDFVHCVDHCVSKELFKYLK